MHEHRRPIRRTRPWPVEHVTATGLEQIAQHTGETVEQVRASAARLGMTSDRPSRMVDLVDAVGPIERPQAANPHDYAYTLNTGAGDFTHGRGDYARRTRAHIAAERADERHERSYIRQHTITRGARIFALAATAAPGWTYGRTAELAARVDAHERARTLRHAGDRIPADLRDVSAFVAYRIAARRQESIGNGES